MLLGLVGLLLARTANTVFVTGGFALPKSIVSIYLDSCFRGALFDFIIFHDLLSMMTFLKGWCLFDGRPWESNT